jgi:RNA polymerase sigma factor (sigma-70 family)
MLQDKLLMKQVKTGSKDALRLIYQKYGRDLLTLAANLLNDKNAAEDVLQDVFISFVQSSPNLHLKGTLKGFLVTCVANRARDLLRKRKRQQTIYLDQTNQAESNVKSPFYNTMYNEELQKLSIAMTRIPYEQREVVVLRLHGDLKFRQIAKFQDVSIKTAISRYRYAINRLRSIMNGELTNETSR